jgi:thiamine biosynthesis protein ThiS
MTIIFNGEPCDVAESATIADLLQRFDFEPRRVAVEVNLELAPRTRHAEWTLKDGDRVEVVTFVGGG